MRLTIFILSLFVHIQLFTQGFECTGSFYLIVFSESESATHLYEIKESNNAFIFDEIALSENRKLTGLAYNTSDLYLWALDVERFELVRINNMGVIESMGKVNNIDESLTYSSGMMSPRGAAYFFLGYDDVTNKALKFYEIDLQQEAFVAEFDDISRSGPSKIQDMAVDPIFGAIYGYNNLDGTIVQFGIDGQIATVSQLRHEEQFIEALFFNRDAAMFGYTAKGEMYAVDKIEGNLRFIQRGPQGTTVDGTACPFTFDFIKSITPRELIACEPFEVNYFFRNNLGVSQTSVQLRDTFPEGFSITNISSSIPYTPAETDGQEHILALNNMIYLMGSNRINVTVEPPDFYFGSFSSRARQHDFAAAFGTIQYSDNPNTEELSDPTDAEIIEENSVALSEQILFSCDGLSATITSPISAHSYVWSTGSTEPQIEVSTPGLYTLRVESNCFVYTDSISVASFPDAKSVSLGDDLTIDAGASILLSPILNRGTPSSFIWKINGDLFNCDNCRTLSYTPEVDARISVTIIDENDCMMTDEIFVRVDYKSNIYVPNVFSPNGDGINDVFYVSSSVPGVVKLSVYNRWGNLIFEKSNCKLSDDSDGWDGFFNGKSMNSGSFIWVAQIDFVTGDSETHTGDFLVISK